KQLRFKVDLDTQHLGNLIDDDETGKKELLEKQFESLQTEINQLSIIDKALITLMLENLSSKEIANIIGLTEPNVRVKIHRIKESLRDSLAKKAME
ncbi:MAG TPA: sigma factor-like helix-turn-helix DNA-binding protein, partial [Sunxiuqinia sp.]|nr:sigma factor-like helix-turn-helix DNA-binding protein [Sunxiuqinia sp.]